MESELAQAVSRVHDRKVAVRADHGGANGVMLDEQRMRLQVSGTDLDAEELMAFATAAAVASLTALQNGEAPIAALLAGCWSDGVQTGLALARVREESAVD